MLFNSVHAVWLHRLLRLPACSAEDGLLGAAAATQGPEHRAEDSPLQKGKRKQTEGRRRRRRSSNMRKG